MRCAVCAALVLTAWLAVMSAGPETGPQTAFRLDERDLVPEGLAYDPVTRAFFVGSTYKRKIVRIDANGRVGDFATAAADGLRAVLGMRVDEVRRRLWVISSHAGRSVPIAGSPRDCIGCSSVLAYDLDTGRPARVWRIDRDPGPHFFNDLVVTRTGDVYITDTIASAIYTIRGESGELERFLPLGEGAAPNGIDISRDGQRLYVAASEGIVVVDLATRRVTPVVLPDGMTPGIDGLYVNDGTLIAIQPFDEGRKVVAYRLRGDAAVSDVHVLDPGEPPSEQPTTGVVVDDRFYYIANSQLQRFRGLLRHDEKFDPDDLSPVVVRWVPLGSRVRPQARTRVPGPSRGR
jgi:sugar lactone lactonase YvrE